MTSEARSGNSAQSSTEVKVVDPVDRWLALGFRGGIIGVGVLGLGLYVRNSRLFARFQHVSRIPKEFLQKEMELKGVVREVSPRGLLKVEHKPIVSLPRFLARKSAKNVTLLNLRLAGLNISDAGLSYLSKDMRLENRPVTFTVLKMSESNSDAADADINVNKKFLHRINLNMDLVRRGYARVHAPADVQHLNALQSNAAYSRLVTRLLMSEKIADRRGVGLWERSSVVESIRSLPATVGQIIKTSTITKLLGYYLALALSGYSGIAFRALGNYVDRLTHVYNGLKSKLKNKSLTHVQDKKQ